MATAQKENKIVFAGIGLRQTPFDESRSGVLIYEDEREKLSYTLTAYTAMRKHNTTKYRMSGRLGGLDGMESGAVALSFYKMDFTSGFTTTININPDFVVREDDGRKINELRHNEKIFELFIELGRLTAIHLVHLYQQSACTRTDIHAVYNELMTLDTRMNGVVLVDPKDSEGLLKEYDRYLR